MVFFRLVQQNENDRGQGDTERNDRRRVRGRGVETVAVGDDQIDDQIDDEDGEIHDKAR